MESGKRVDSFLKRIDFLSIPIPRFFGFDPALIILPSFRHAFAMHKKRKHGPIDPNTASSATPGTPGVQRKRKSGASAAAAAVAAANAAAAAAAITHVQEPEVKSVILG